MTGTNHLCCVHIMMRIAKKESVELANWVGYKFFNFSHLDIRDFSNLVSSLSLQLMGKTILKAGERTWCVFRYLFLTTDWYTRWVCCHSEGPGRFGERNLKKFMKRNAPREEQAHAPLHIGTDTLQSSFEEKDPGVLVDNKMNNVPSWWRTKQHPGLNLADSCQQVKGGDLSSLFWRWWGHTRSPVSSSASPVHEGYKIKESIQQRPPDIIRGLENLSYTGRLRPEKRRLREICWGSL